MLCSFSVNCFIHLFFIICVINVYVKCDILNQMQILPTKLNKGSESCVSYLKNNFISINRYCVHIIAAVIIDWSLSIVLITNSLVMYQVRVQYRNNVILKENIKRKYHMQIVASVFIPKYLFYSYMKHFLFGRITRFY